MSAKTKKIIPTPLEDLQRAAMEQAQLDKLCRASEILESIRSPTVDEMTLHSMGIVLGQPLDVDGSGRWDFATSFFLPWVDEDLVREVDEYHNCRRGWIDQYAAEYTPVEWKIPASKARWFEKCLYWLCELDSGVWDPWSIDPTEMYRSTGLTLPMYWFRSEDRSEILRQYQSKWAYFPVDQSKPHAAAFVFDSNEASTQVLRSEVDYALELAKFRLQNGQHTNHHTKPALIYTIERDSFARITQVHFDIKTDKLVLRQSRQLDLRGPEPTDDAFILVRWMANRPVGETEYVEEEEEEEKEEGQGDGTMDDTGTAPMLLVGCA